ncbi:hypothetical protein BH20ACI2_BH20ACI2_09050 [soil metagenome]
MFFAQSNSQEKSKKRAFGSSLEKFEKKGEPTPKDDKQNNQKKTFRRMMKRFV